MHTAPSGKQAQSALRIWKRQMESPGVVTPSKPSTPMKAINSLNSSSPKTTGVITPLPLGAASASATKKKFIPRTPLTAIAAMKGSGNNHSSLSNGENQRAIWSAGALPTRSNERYWLLEAKIAHKRLDEVREQLALECESRLVLSRQFTETSKQLVESNKLRAQRDLELSELTEELTQLKDQMMRLDMEKADDNYSISLSAAKERVQPKHAVEEGKVVADDRDIYSYDMTPDSAFYDESDANVSVSGVTDVSVGGENNRELQILDNATSMDNARLRMQVDFLKSEVSRARRSIEKHRNRAAEAKATAALQSKYVTNVIHIYITL
jgi:hypothetical protein